MKTKDVIQGFEKLFKKGYFDRFNVKYNKPTPYKGDIDILLQKNSYVYCIQIKELIKHKDNELYDGMKQLREDKYFISCEKKWLVEKTKRLNNYNFTKLILIYIAGGNCAVYLFGDNIENNKNVALGKAKILEFKEFMAHLERYLRF